MTGRLVRAAVATFAAGLVAAGCGGGGTADAPAPVPHVAVTGATLGETSTSLVVGATERLVATVAPPDATDPRVAWSTSDARIADVTTSGVVLGVGVGVAVITATTVDGGFAASCAVTVQPSSLAVTGVSVAPVLLELDVELVPTGLLTATVAPSNATDRRVTWTSSDPRIATVSDAGVVTGVQRGSAVVIATTVDGGKLAGAVVSVTEPAPAVVPVASVSLGKASTTLEVGASEQLAADVLPLAAVDKRVVWSTSDNRVVSVTALGRITGVGKGMATITATTIDGGKTARCEVTVTSTAVAVTGVTLDQTTLSLSIGSAGTLKASVAPADATTPALTWEIRPGGIARLAGSGTTATITGLNIGVATVTVTSNDNPGLSATATVYVTPVAVTGVALSQTRLTLTAAASGATDGTTAPLTATVAPADATNREVQWTTSDALVATLTSTGGATVTVVAHHAGTATITATSADGRKTAQCAVTVDPNTTPVVAVAAISVNPTALDLEPGSTGTVAALLVPRDATNQDVYWTSSDPAVASLSATTGGVVTLTGVKPGTATVTATSVDGGRSAWTDVKVWVLDAEIPTSTVRALTADSSGSYSTRSASGAFVEVPIDKLLYYGLDRAFLEERTGGIVLDYYASGSYTAPAAVGDSVGLAGQSTVVQVKSYVAVPAARLANVGTASVKVAVTARRWLGSPRVALWAQGRVVGVSDVVTAAGTYTFDGVPAGQINVFDGGLQGSRLSIDAIRIEPSSTPVPAFAP